MANRRKTNIIFDQIIEEYVRKQKAFLNDFTLIDQRLKVLHIIEMMLTFFVINKGWHGQLA